MSTSDRTWPEPFEVPDHVLGRLRAAADDELERACDTGGEWNDTIRTRVLNAARVVEVFDIASLAPAQVAALAGRAIELEFEGPFAAPQAMEDLNAFVARFGMCRELIVLRDAAAARVQEITPSEGSA